MFSRRDRLTRAAFPAALAHGRRLSSANFSIVVPSGAKGYAIVVPKKVARLSVTRHRTKRRVSAALRALSFPPSLIVFPRAAVADMKYRDIRSELESLLSKIGKAT